MTVKKQPVPISFAGSRIDRADAIRSDPDRLAALFTPAARLMLLDGLIPQLDEAGGLAWGSLADAAPEAELVFLGLLDDRPCFAPVPLQGSLGDAPPRQAWDVIGRLDGEDLAHFGAAKALVDWHARHRFCARCGGATRLAKGGWQRDCTGEGCRAQHFPRVDPVTIMLVEHAGQLLLGRQPRFPPRFYSALAGFLEPGETIEEAVAREVLEEAGVRVRDVTYVASQPWPFPSSLMIGCHALADDPALVIDRTELDDARWFTRAEVIAALAEDPAAPLAAPPPRAIAHQLLRWWIARGE